MASDSPVTPCLLDEADPSPSVLDGVDGAGSPFLARAMTAPWGPEVAKLRDEIQASLKAAGRTDYSVDDLAEMNGFIDDEPESLEFWTEMLAEARTALAVSQLDAAGRAAYNKKLEDLRKAAIASLQAAGAFSCMLWEQMGEGEEFELDPEKYWTNIIRRAEEDTAAKRRKAEHAAAEAKRKAECAARAAAGAPGLKETLEAAKTASAMCSALVESLDLEEAFVRDPALRAALEDCLRRAFTSYEFAHSSLSVAEEVQYMLRNIRKRADLVM
jgi:hypothetical protein